MRSARLSLALETGALTLPTSGKIAVYRPTMGDDLSALPRDRVVGISKLARVLHGFSQRLQIQERLTAEVAQCIWEHLKPHGVAVVIEASHGCMTGRGVRTPGVTMTTSRLMGTFLKDERSRKEVLSLMGY